MMDRMYERTAELMEADIGEELVALDPEGGKCFGFNSVATAVWRQLEQPQTFDQLRDALLEHYEVDEAQCTLELTELLGDMAQKGLIGSRPDGTEREPTRAR